MYKEKVIELKFNADYYKLIQVTNIDEVFDELIATKPSDVKVLDERIPYWTELWPAAMALSEFIAENESMFKDKSAIELGSGLALPSIVASQFVSTILISDYLEDALIYAKKNVTLNKIENAHFKLLDWRELSNNFKYDIILASDIAYEKRFFSQIPEALKKLMHQESIVLLSEPGRVFAKEFIDSLYNEFIVQSNYKVIKQRGGKFDVGIYNLKLKSS
jgi:predicted nicotinamide N-methyase